MKKMQCPQCKWFDVEEAMSYTGRGVFLCNNPNCDPNYDGLIGHVSASDGCELFSLAKYPYALEDCRFFRHEQYDMKNYCGRFSSSCDDFCCGFSPRIPKKAEA